jgi:hypothetical protein
VIIIDRDVSQKINGPGYAGIKCILLIDKGFTQAKDIPGQIDERNQFPDSSTISERRPDDEITAQTILLHCGIKRCKGIL